MDKSTKSNQSRGTVSWAQAVRDMVIASINRGQLPILGIIGIATVLTFRLPEQDISRVVFEIVAALKKGELWAYVLEGLTLFGWFTHAKVMRKIFSAEAERIGCEKSKIQSKSAGVEFKSSDKK